MTNVSILSLKITEDRNLSAIGATKKHTSGMTATPQNASKVSLLGTALHWC